jgi:hypothetical protein
VYDIGREAEKTHFFQISTPTKTMVLAADSEETKEKWIAGLQAYIAPTPVSSIFAEQVYLQNQSYFLIN